LAIPAVLALTLALAFPNAGTAWIIGRWWFWVVYGIIAIILADRLFRFFSGLKRKT
jgi:hypothetical protein